MGLVLLLCVLTAPLLVRATWQRRQRRALRASWGGIGSVERDEAFSGFKVAQLVVGAPGTAWLAGVTSRRYGVDATAECPRRGCGPPGTDCECGFHAFRDRDEALALLCELTLRHPTRAYVLLTVDLDGSVLEYERGFRAARQRVHRVAVPALCLTCLAQGEQRPARDLVTHPSFRSERVVLGGATARNLLPYGSAPARGACARHQPGPGGRRVRLDELRSALTTEVELLPVGDLPLRPAPGHGRAAD